MRIIDFHHHIGHRGKTVDDILRHMDAHGVERAVLLVVDRFIDEHVECSNEEVLRAAKAYPDRFVPFCHVDPRRPDRVEIMKRLMQAEYAGFGEHKVPVPIDDPRSVELFAMAGERGWPVVVHFEAGAFNTEFMSFPRVLEQLKDVRFVAHAQTWWAHISADVPDPAGYPKGPVRRPGVVDEWLGRYENLYCDLSANSGFNALNRDRAFARDFVSRHYRKLLWGTDCPCRDGRGKGFQGLCYAARSLPLLRELVDDSEKLAAILGGNALRLLGLA